MHIPWGWIKQRPQFLAEHLSEHYQVKCVYNKYYRTQTVTDNVISHKIDIKQLYILPYSRFKLVKYVNDVLIRLQIYPDVKRHDIIWLTSPNQYKILKNMIRYDCKIVYDCMDDMLELSGDIHDVKKSEKFKESEEQLLKRSDIVFVSSGYLQQKLVDRYGCIANMHVINNAINICPETSSPIVSKESLPHDIETVFAETELIKLVYIGTISEWLDVDLIYESLRVFPQISYVFIGPSTIRMKEHERIHFCGAVQHSQLFSIMGRSDALIMPFVVNEIVKAVNPVKLYEYVFSNKPVISVKYKESEKFDDYVYLYSNIDEYLNLLDTLLKGKLHAKNNDINNKKFAMENCWNNRIKDIIEHLNQILSNRIEALHD